MERSPIDVGLWAALLAVAVYATYASLAPEVSGAQVIPDKLAHAILYLVLTSLSLLAAVWRPGRPAGSGQPARAWAVGGAVLVFGMLLESAQSLVPARQVDATDVLANAVGILVAITLWRVLRARLGAHP